MNFDANTVLHILDDFLATFPSLNQTQYHYLNIKQIAMGVNLGGCGHHEGMHRVSSQSLRWGGQHMSHPPNV